MEPITCLIPIKFIIINQYTDPKQPNQTQFYQTEHPILQPQTNQTKPNQTKPSSIEQNTQYSTTKITNQTKTITQTKIHCNLRQYYLINQKITQPLTNKLITQLK